MGSLASSGAVLINRVRPSVSHLIEVLPDIGTPATLDAFREFLSSVSPLKPRTVQETLNAETQCDQRDLRDRKGEHLRNTSESSARQ